jgi:hypothetical protein
VALSEIYSGTVDRGLQSCMIGSAILATVDGY